VIHSTTYIFHNSTENITDLRLPIEIKLEILSKDQLASLKTVRDINTVKLEQFQNRYNHGDICFAAKTGRKHIAYAWVRLHGFMNVLSTKKSYPIAESCFWIFDCRTNENYRGMGIYPWLLSRILRFYSSTYKYAYMDTVKSNKASIKGILKSGFLLCKKVILIKIPRFPIRFEVNGNI